MWKVVPVRFASSEGGVTERVSYKCAGLSNSKVSRAAPHSERNKKQQLHKYSSFNAFSIQFYTLKEFIQTQKSCMSCTLLTGVKLEEKRVRCKYFPTLFLLLFFFYIYPNVYLLYLCA